MPRCPAGRFLLLALLPLSVSGQGILTLTALSPANGSTIQATPSQTIPVAAHVNSSQLGELVSFQASLMNVTCPSTVPCVHSFVWSRPAAAEVTPPDGVNVTFTLGLAGLPAGTYIVQSFLSATASTGAYGASLQYTLTINVTSAATAPTISGIANGASFAPGGPISAGSWVAIFGTGLAPTGDSRTWNPATEIVNGKFPVSLDGTQVTVNRTQAPVEFIQPSQVNIQMPDDVAVGPVQVVVTTQGGASNSFTVNIATFAPGLFTANAPYIVAQHADSSYVTTASPAIPGEVIILWGTGFGPANPSVPTGQFFSGANPLANSVTMTVTIGGQPAAVDFAGVVAAGLVQINVHVPPSIGNGNAAVVASVAGVSTQPTANMIAIHN